MNFLFLVIISCFIIFSVLPDADAKTWKVYVGEMPKQ